MSIPNSLTISSPYSCHSLLQRISPTQGSNSGLPHCRLILYHLNHLESPILAQGKQNLFSISLLTFQKLFIYLFLFFNWRIIALQCVDSAVQQLESIIIIYIYIYIIYTYTHTHTHTHIYAAAAPAKSLQSCPTLCNPINGSPPGSPVPGILQARTLEWVAISFSNAWKWKVKVKSLSRVWLLATPRIVAYQASPSMGFSRQEYWSGVPLPSLIYIYNYRASLIVQLVKNLPAMQESWVWSLDLDHTLEKRNATHSSILAWRILGCKELDTTD